MHRRWRQGLIATLALLGAAAQAAETGVPACVQAPAGGCYASFTPPGPRSAVLHYYASAVPGGAGLAPDVALVALHGHGRDADKTFRAAVATAQAAARGAQTLVIAPLFQVQDGGAQGSGRSGCSTPGVPGPQDGDLLWTCSSWVAGEAALGGGPTSFAVLDALLAHLHQQWPSLQRATLAGFSAGGQLVQRYVGFAEAQSPHPLPVRYVVADPGSWLYFDPERPVPTRAGTVVAWDACAEGSDPLGRCVLQWRASDPACPAEQRWKFGTDDLPARLGRSAAEARSRYARAELRYLQGAADSGSGKGTAYSLLDRSCGAMAQGPYRLQRGLAYAAYDRRRLATENPRTVGLAPGCAHDVACVFPSEAGRAALLGD